MLSLAGCADDDSGKDGEVILIPPYSGPVPTLESTTLPPGPIEEIDVIGTLTAPIPGCLVLESDEGLWELTGMLTDQPGPGDEVEVFGQVALHEEGGCSAPVLHVQKIAILRSVGHQPG